MSLDRMTEEPNQVQKQVLHGALITILRQVLGQGLNIVGGILVARYLSQSENGLYAVLVFVSSLLPTFICGGITAGLIRQIHNPTISELKTAQYLQQVASIILAVIFIILSPVISQELGIAGNGYHIFIPIAFSFIFISLQSIPSALMQRNLNFKKLAMIEVAQTLVFNLVVAGMILNGFGGETFAWAICIRSVIGAILFNFKNSSCLYTEGKFNRTYGKELLRFGVPYQSVGIVSFIKDSIHSIYLTKVVSLEATGRIDWASKVSSYPVLVLMILQKLYLPAFSRLQKDRIQLKSFLENILFITNFMVAPLAVATLVYIHPITKLVFDPRWIEAIPLFYFLWISNIFAPSSAPLLTLLQANGFPKTSLFFATLWMAVTWVFGVPLIIWKQELGFVIANVIVQLTNIALIYRAKKEVNFSFFSLSLPSWVLAITCIFICKQIMNPDQVTSIFQLGLYITLFGMIFVISGLFIFKRRFQEILNIWRGTN